MHRYLFTSESVAVGHPDKVADQISDAILDSCLVVDPHAKVACETMVSAGLVILAGEITTAAHLDYQKIVRETIEQIGYTDPMGGFCAQSCGVINIINRQSAEISACLHDEGDRPVCLGAGDQGLMFGFACDETPQLMPLPIVVAHAIVRELRHLREMGELAYLRPDAKSQVTVEYGAAHTPMRLHTVVLSTQHEPGVARDRLESDMKELVKRVAPRGLIDDKTLFYINPSGSFIHGGPSADCGLTGRKIIVDTYGGMGHHGGGAFSGKDPTKVDRSASYAARYVAKNIVAAKLARRCEVQISYAIGFSRPISIKVETFGTAQVAESLLSQVVPLVFDLTPYGIIDMLQLRRPIYLQTAFGGHFGREEAEFSWEQTDRTEQLLQAVKQAAFAI